jgi:nitrate reductase assembly molybdenum cofactor insertion protein NarJ
VAWFEYKTIGFDLHNRHKLASDIMNYSNIQLEEYKAKLKAAIELIPLEDEEHLIVSKIETLIDLT